MNQAKSPPKYVVAIVGSAGALESFERIFDGLPSNLGVAFVVLQHLEKTQKSHLAELLARHTRMPVKVAQDGDALEADHVYVNEPGAVLEIREGVLHSRMESDNRFHHPFDHFLESLAAQLGPLSIGVIVSGAGADGARGMKALSDAGARTFAQDPSEAKFSEMPSSAIAASAVDRFLSCDMIARGLIETIESNEPELSEICRILLAKTGHDFSDYKRSTVARRVDRRLQACHCATIGDYVSILERDPLEAQALLKDLLIGVTQFFRDPDAFRSLQTQVIPELFARARRDDGLRAWVPACSSGEEAYTLAILLHEHRRKEELQVPLLIFATDLDRISVEAARTARYPESAVSSLPTEYVARYFRKVDGMYQVTQQLREMCVFSEHSLIKDAPFSRIDLVSCRNLFIYWENELQSKVLPILHYSLNPNGYLFLGPAENVSAAADLFKPVDKKFRIFQKKESVQRKPLAFPIAHHPVRTRGYLESALPVAAASGRDPGRIIASALLDHYAPPAMVINDRGEVVFFSGRTGRFLEPSTGTPSSNIFDLVRTAIRPELHAAVHKTIQTKREVMHPGIAYEVDGAVHKLSLAVRPMPELSDGTELYLVVFQDLETSKTREEAVREGIAISTPNSIIQQLEAELRSTREHLQSTIEEVKSSNEELLSMNEELQSANEELQTSKEEQQSANEELETVNAELSRKIEELDHANSDLQNFFQSTQVPTVFLNGELKIQKFTPAIARVFRIITADVGRSFTDISSYLDPFDLIGDLEQVLHSLRPIEKEVRTQDGAVFYLMRILPYKTVNNVINGLVITFTDVTDLKRAQAQESRLAAIVESSDDAIVSKDLNAVITSWNRGAEQLLGYSAAEMVGHSIYKIVPPDHAEDVANVLNAIKRGERVHHYETERMHKDGHRVQVSLSVSPLRDSNGQIIGASKIARDISERKRAEALMERGIRLRDEFISIASHELKTPLTSIKLQAQLMKRTYERNGAGSFTPERVLKLIDQTEKQVDRLQHLVEDMLDISRIGAGKLKLQREPTDLAIVTRGVLEMLSNFLSDAGCPVSEELDFSGAASGHWDRHRVEQVVTNFLTNAARYASGRPVKVTVRAEERWAVLEVKDHGIGISPSDQSRIFERFERATSVAQGGFGIGLYIVREIVQAHGGKVEVESELGKGSTFRARFPR